MRYDKEAKHKRKAPQAGMSESPITGLWGTAGCITNHSKVTRGNTTMAPTLYKHIICQTVGQ